MNQPYILAIPDISETEKEAPQVVCGGVSCEVLLTEDRTYDYGLVRVEPGYATPKQTVVEPNSLTFQILQECHQAELRVLRSNGTLQHYVFNHLTRKGTTVEIYYGDTMQWLNFGDSPLVFLEECHPPFKDTRYSNNS